MKLIQLLELCSDSIVVDIVDINTDVAIASYDGKNSIPKYLNDCILSASCINVNIKDDYFGCSGSIATMTIKVDTEIILTETGRRNVERYIRELESKAKEIIDAGKDTSDNTTLPTCEDIINDVKWVGLDDDGEYYNGWSVTDHYEADYPLLLKYGRDLKFAKEDV